MNVHESTGRRHRPTLHSAFRVAVLAAVLVSGAAARCEEPYRLLVCLQFSDDPLFTRLYSKALERQVRDQLGSYFGSLAQVDVTAAHPLIERLAENDVRHVQLAASEFAALQVPDKAFVFSLEIVEGMYHVHWRQLDGLTQQISPSQSVSTPDRQWLAKAVCLAVREDFAPVVIVQPDDKVKDLGQVKLQFASAAQRVLVSRWLTLNTILQPFWVLKQKDGSLTRVPIPNTVLRIGKNDTGGTATFHSNAAQPWKPTPRLVRYEALKISAQKGHLRLRLLNAADGSPLLGCVVRANTTGFASLSDSHQFTLPDRRGTVVSLTPIENLAFVEIVQGGSSRLTLPVPITGPMCEVTLKVPLDESAKQKSDWERRLRYLVQDVSILQTSINNQVRDTNQMHEEKKYEEELRLIQGVLADVAASRKSASDARSALSLEAQELKLPPHALLAWAEGQIDEIANTEKSLSKKADDLDKMIKKMDAQARAQVLINAGDAAADFGDWYDALDKYELALNEQPDQPKLAERLKNLKSIWEIKSPQHEQARTFIFESWPKLEVTQLEAKFAEADAALATLQGVGDTLTAKRLFSVNNDHVGAVSGVIDLLISSGTERDLEDAGKYKQLLDKLAELQTRLGDFIQNASAASGGNAKPAEAAAEEEMPTKI